MSKSDPRDIDEDAILRGLSAEELEKLEYELQEMDPEVQQILYWHFNILYCQNVPYTVRSPFSGISDSMVSKI